MDENKVAAKTGGNIAKKARLELEAKTGRRSSPARTICRHAQSSQEN